MCIVYVRGDNLAGVVISDQEYPSRVSHTLITKILDEFSQKYPPSTWSTLTEKDVSFPQINSYLAKYQNPKEADAMTKIQEELDETKIILVSKQMEQIKGTDAKLDMSHFSRTVTKYYVFNFLEAAISILFQTHQISLKQWVEIT